MTKKIALKADRPGLTGYNHLLADIGSILQQGLSRAYKAVDNLKVQTYWQIGERIAREELRHKERADYGKEVIKLLSLDLNIAEQTLRHMIRFYRTYPIISAVWRELSWSHYRILIYAENKEVRQFYEQQTVLNLWSTRELEKQFQNDLYSRMKKQGKLTINVPIPVEPALPEQLFKDTYNFDFLTLDENHSETDLENALISNTEKLLLEFGPDFSISGRQRKIMIDGQTHKVDLEFYHRGVPCIVLVDLKIGKFKSEYAGQMNKYLNWYKEHKRYSWEKDPIGIIICRNKGIEEVHYALGSISNYIFISEYKVKLPSETEIKDAFGKSI